VFVPVAPTVDVSVPAVLTGSFNACIGPETQPDPCGGAGIEFLATITIDLPGLLTYHFVATPNPELTDLTTADFTSIPEPSTFVLLLAGFAMFAAAPKIYCTMRRCLRRNAGVS
jgi:hypothetical protein